LKTILVHFEDKTESVEIPDEQLTCGWLFSEVIRACSSPDSVVALRTTGDIEIKDYWLTQYDRQLMLLKDQEELTIVHREEMPPILCKQQFTPLKVIGKGGFSKVLLGNPQSVRRKDSGQLYAMKIIKKQFIVRAKKLSQIATERKVMGLLNHPFIVKLNWAFQSVTSMQTDELCLVMDFCPGGELFFHLHNIGRFSEDQAKFYFAEVLIALEHLHSLDIVYRDLKPENILLDLDGHVRLADFGLAKDRMHEGALTYSFCGSPEYMSPEMLEKRGHGRAVDYYSLGALLYEMVTGLPPFYSTDKTEMYEQISFHPLPMPPFISRSARSLLEGLLHKNPTERLGARFGIEEIKAHPWCSKIKWGKLLQRKILPPFRPNFTNSNFDPQYTQMQIDDEALEAEPGPHFPNYDYDYDRQEAERSIQVTESTKSSTAIKSFWSKSVKESGDLTPDSKQDLLLFTQAAEKVPRHKVRRVSSNDDIGVESCRTPPALSMPHAIFDSVPVNPSRLFHQHSSPSLSIKPFSISPASTPTSIAGGRFDPVQIKAKRITSERRLGVNRTTVMRRLPPRH
jgi:serine/threonine protein kinase